MRKSQPLLEDAQLNLMTVTRCGCTPSSPISFARGTPNTLFMGTRVSGRKTAGKKPELGTFGVSIDFVSRSE
jgi:hypothetical protein